MTISIADPGRRPTQAGGMGATVDTRPASPAVPKWGLVLRPNLAAQRLCAVGRGGYGAGQLTPPIRPAERVQGRFGSPAR